MKSIKKKITKIFNKERKSSKKKRKSTINTEYGSKLGQ